MSDNPHHTSGKTSMTYGLIIAVVLIFLAVMAWILGVENSRWLRYINWAAQLGVVYWCLRNWRDQHNGGYATYGQSVKAGIKFMFFASIIFAFYNVIYMKWLDPEAIPRMMDAMEESYYKMGLDEDQAKTAVDIMSMIKSPVMQFFSGIIGITFAGVILSLIVSIFIRKEGDPFSQAMAELDDHNNGQNKE